MMSIYKDGMRLYLNPWEFNSCRLLMELAKIVEDHGGRVKYNRLVTISDRRANDDVAIGVTLHGYIRFVLDDVVYYYQHEENPFFPFYYSKTPVRNGKYSRDAVLDELPKTWQYDCFLASNCPDDYIRVGAEMVFELLMDAPMSVIRPDYKMVDVPNLYDGGYHQEKIRNERVMTLDF